MFCGKCGMKLDDNGVCLTCSSVKPNVISSESNKIKLNKNIIIVIGILLVVILGVFVVIKMMNKTDRSETLTNLEKNEYLKFTIDENEFYLGDLTSTYQDKKYSYDEKYIKDNDYVPNDSIVSQTFYNENGDALFLGALYCQKGSDCSYKDTVLIKINFYEESDILVNDYIKFGMKYDDIVEKYGKEDGTFYQDEDLLVWTFGSKGKIGEPYYIIRFDDSGLFSNGGISEIRIGVWWYEGEYEHTVIKGSKENK